MKNALRYKGYVAQITIETDDDVLCGSVVNTEDTIHFEGRTVSELKVAFAETVDDYIRYCEERGEQPEKPYSGNLRVRMSSKVHKQADQAARVLGVSLNTFIVDAVESKAEEVVLWDVGRSVSQSYSTEGWNFIETDQGPLLHVGDITIETVGSVNTGSKHFVASTSRNFSAVQGE